MKNTSLLLLFLLIGINFPSCSRLKAETLIVAVDPNPPFAFIQDEKWYGLDIDLIRSIARENDWDYELLPCKTVGDILGAVSSGKANIGLAGITINSARERDIDFSQPYFDNGGTQLLMSSNAIKVSWRAKWNKIMPTLKGTLIVLFIILTVFAHIMWLTERLNGDEDNFSRQYCKGIGQAYWWSIVTATTVGYGDITPKKAMGRILAGLVMIIGIMWFGCFTGAMSSVLTTLQQDATSTSAVEMMNGKKIGTKTDSTAHGFLTTSAGVSIVTTNDIQKLCEMVSDGKIDGVFFDYPALKRYADSHNEVALVGDIVQSEKYGIVMEENSKYAEAINRSILKFKEDGRYDKIYQKWFK